MCIHVFMKRQQYYCYSCPAVVCHLMSCSFSFPHTTRLHVVLSMTLLLIWMLSWNLPLRFSWFFSPVLNGMTRIDERSSDDNSAMDTVVAKKSNGRVTVKELNRLISDVQEYPLEPNSNWYVSIFSVLRMSYTIYIMRVVGCCCSSRWVWNVPKPLISAWHRRGPLKMNVLVCTATDWTVSNVCIHGWCTTAIV